MTSSIESQVAGIRKELVRMERVMTELREAMMTPEATGPHGWLLIDSKAEAMTYAAEALRRSVAGCGPELAPGCYYHDMDESE